MRFAKPSVVIAAVLAIACSTVAVAGALISGAGGSVVWLTAPPPSVALNALQSATQVYAFDERQMVTLSGDVGVDAVDPGTYTSFPNGSASVAAGTVVDSHLVHSDPTPGGIARRRGSLTFTGDVVGVAASNARLAATDSTLGAPATGYSGTSARWRGLEAKNSTDGADTITISADRRTITFDLRTPLYQDQFRVLTRHTDQLTTTIVDTPDPVSVGNDVQYALQVRNTGGQPVADAHVDATIPAGTTLVSTDAPGGCTGSGPLDCSVGPLAVGESGTVRIVVTTPTEVPSGGTVTMSAVATPGANTTVTESTTVEIPDPGESSGFVVPGGSIDTGGDEPALLELPGSGPGAPVIITQGAGSFCAGPCSGIATEISPFPGYDDPMHPIRLRLTYAFPDSPTSLTDAASAFGATIYKNTDPDHPEVGSIVPWCDTPGAGVAVPHPCVDGHTITQPTPNSFVVTFDIVYLSGDPRFARK